MCVNICSLQFEQADFTWRNLSSNVHNQHQLWIDHIFNTVRISKWNGNCKYCTESVYMYDFPLFRFFFVSKIESILNESLTVVTTYLRKGWLLFFYGLGCKNLYCLYFFSPISIGLKIWFIPQNCIGYRIVCPVMTRLFLKFSPWK